MTRIESFSGRRRHQRGVTLIEALVAMLVMSLGLLGFAGLHARLRLNSDVARQRAEAVRLAQEDIENLRAFSTLAAYTSITSGTTASKATLASDIVQSLNTSYTISRTLADSASPRMKQLMVRYSWLDRSGTQQNVTLRSTIAGVDPKLAAALNLPPNGTPVKDPMGRDVQIPIPAKNLGDGTSVYKPTSAGTVAFVFSNETGRVTKKCTGIASTTKTAQIDTSTLASATCTDIDGLIVSGYVRFSLANNLPPQGDNLPANDVPPGPLEIRLTLDDRTIPPGFVGWRDQLEDNNYWRAPPNSANYTKEGDDCGAEDSITVSYNQAVNITQVVDTAADGTQTTQNVTTLIRFVTVPASLLASVQAGGSTAAVAIQPYTGIASVGDISNVAYAGERYVAYACVVRPINLGGSTVAWTGRTAIMVGGTSWAIGTSNNAVPPEFRVCRFSSDYDGDGQIYTLGTSSNGDKVTKIDNEEHARAYLHVTTSLSNQNFLVVLGKNSCPVDSTFNRAQIGTQGYSNFIDETTVQHQP